MSASIFTMILSSTSFSFAKEVKSLSLDEAIKTGTENSTQIELNKLDYSVKKIELDQANDQERKYKRAGYSLGTVEGFLLDENMLSKQASFALEEEKIKGGYLEENVKFNITASYYGALQAKENVTIQEMTLTNIEKNHDLVKKQEELGTSSKSDVYFSEIALNEGKINLENARKAYKESIRNLNMVMNIPLDTDLNLTSTFKLDKFDANLEADIEKAYGTRFDMIQLNNNYKIAKLDFDTNAGVYTPNTYNYMYKERTVKKIETILSDSKQGVEFDIRNKYDEIVSSQKQIELAKANVEKATEGLRLKELAHKLNSNTALEVKEAIVQLNQANLALSGAISNYNLKVLEYNQAVNIGNLK